MSPTHIQNTPNHNYSTSHNTNMLAAILLPCQKTASKHLQLPGSHQCLILNPNSPRSVTSPHLSDEQIPLHTSISYTAKTYENLSVLGAACLSSIPLTPQPRQQQRLHYTWGPTKPCGWRLANAWGAWLGLIIAVVRFAVITIGEIMAIRTLVSGAVPIFLKTVTLPLLPRSTVLITSSLAPSACIAIASS